MGDIITVSRRDHRALASLALSEVEDERKDEPMMTADRERFEAMVVLVGGRVNSLLGRSIFQITYPSDRVGRAQLREDTGRVCVLCESRESEADRLRAELEQAHKRVADLEADIQRLRDAPPIVSDPSWTTHDTRLFRLLPAVIEAAKLSSTWPKQAVFVPDLMKEYGLTNADAKALDAVTRPDDLRGK